MLREHSRLAEAVERIIIPNHGIPWNLSTGVRDWQMACFIKSVWVHVFKAYGGVATTPRLKIQATAPSAFDIASIDLASTGPRYVDAFTTTGAVGGDALTSASCMSFIRTLRFNISRGGGSGFSDAANLMPEAVVILEVVKLPVADV